METKKLSKKYRVIFGAHGSASYEVEAQTIEEAKENAAKKASLSDVEVADWDCRVTVCDENGEELLTEEF